MSSGNVEAVRRALAALDRRDVEAYLEVAENFDDFRYEVRGIRDAQDRVVALVDTIGRITPTGVEVSQRLGFVVSGFRDGTFREVRAFPSWHEVSKPWGCRSSPEYDRRVIATSEYDLVTESAGLLDRSERAMFTVRGGEAADFLQGQVSNDVESLAPGHGCYAAILNHKGKLRTDLRVLRGQDFFWLDTEPIGHAVLRHMLDTYSLGRDVQWEDVGEAHSILSLLGPGADAPLDDPPPPNEHDFVDTGAGLWVRTDLGIDLLCSNARADELRAELGVEEVSEEVAECLRIESGRPRLGLDMDADTIPQEAGINERAVDFEKGCYVGQETVARLHYKGKPNRHLRGLRLSEPAERRAEIALGEKVVGRIGSVCVSPRLGPIALALVRREAAPGDTVLVDGAEAQVAELPFGRD